MAVTTTCQCPHCSSEQTCALQILIFGAPLFSRCIFTGSEYLVECPYFSVAAKEAVGV